MKEQTLEKKVEKCHWKIAVEQAIDEYAKNHHCVICDGYDVNCLCYSISKSSEGKHDLQI